MINIKKWSLALVTIVALSLILCACNINFTSQTANSSSASARPWSFGVISDTQWTVPDDGYNPNTTAANIIKQVDRQFINAGIKLVVAVGDTIDKPSKVNINTRALYAQDLYNADIGFYPLRGNHEAAEDPTYLDSGLEFQHAFPQIGTGVNNNTPEDITTAIIPAGDLANNSPATKTGGIFTVGSNFSMPTAVNAANKSLSYSFQYSNATFMLLDQFDGSGNYYNSSVPLQQPWISDTLSRRPTNTHAFVFIHKNILGGNHKDNMFGSQLPKYDASGNPMFDANGNPLFESDPGDCSGFVPYGTDAQKAAQQAFMAAKQGAENNFLASMQSNNVYFVISGHDHHHYESLVTSPDGRSRVHQLIAQSDSSKFYTPVAPVSVNDAPIQQDLGRVGYYIFTVDGPRVTIDYFGDSTGGSYYGPNGGAFNFVKMSTISYSLNGKEKLVAQGTSYTMTDDTTVAAAMETGFKGTLMSILSGTNGSNVTTNYGNKISNNLNTSWAVANPGLASDVLSLGGMSMTSRSSKTDEYVLSISYIPDGSSRSLIQNDHFGLLARDSSGKWVNAVTMNSGGIEKFVTGAWDPIYKLGTCGVDTTTNTAWAVINYNGDFAAGQFPSFQK
jgi:hypothetical protein